MSGLIKATPTISTGIYPAVALFIAGLALAGCQTVNIASPGAGNTVVADPAETIKATAAAKTDDERSAPDEDAE